MTDRDDNPPAHPGLILLERVMRPLGISRNQLARDLDVPVGRISDLTNGKRGITADTALRLARYFGVAPQLWLRLQAEYDLHVVRTTTWREIEPRVRVLDANKPSHLAGSGSDRGPAEAELVGELTSEIATEASPNEPAAVQPDSPEASDAIAIPPLPPDDER